MQFLLALLAAGLVISPVIALPAHEQLDKRQNVVTMGAPGGVHPRFEIRQMLFHKPNQWNLYLQALAEFQNMNHDDPLSYFAIAGIHGEPSVGYSGVGRGGNGIGFCSHGDFSFATWHRPYVALYEQQMYSIVNRIAREYPKDRLPFMIGAASTFRVPYFDWGARPSDGYPAFPNIMSSETIGVYTAQGHKTIRNPLYAFDFQGDEGKLFYSPYNEWPNTLRWPTSNNPNAQSNEQAMVNAFDGNQGQPYLQRLLYDTFSTCHSYLPFSNENSGDGHCSNSLEVTHNQVHLLIGGTRPSGTMTPPSVSAFDPSFMLHHANVDRMIAFWQTINPNSWGGSQRTSFDTYVRNRGTFIDSNTALYPFRSPNGGFWTTNSVRDWTQFGYTYYEYTISDGSASSIMGFVNDLYGPNPSRRAGQPRAKRSLMPQRLSTEETDDESAEFASAEKHLEARHSSLAQITDVDGQRMQYFVTVTAPVMALGGSYRVYVFTGEPTTQSGNWDNDKHFAGSVAVFAGDGMRDNNNTMTGTVPLTDHLTKYLDEGLLGSLLRPLVAPFLAKHLTWKILSPQGEVLDPTAVPNFKVSCTSAKSTRPASRNELPVWSAFEDVVEATLGKVGGVGHSILHGYPNSGHH